KESAAVSLRFRRAGRNRLRRLAGRKNVGASPRTPRLGLPLFHSATLILLSRPPTMLWRLAHLRCAPSGGKACALRTQTVRKEVGVQPLVPLLQLTLVALHFWWARGIAERTHLEYP
ncbi:MAG: hypothetical protein J2P36_27295, partial [Ktedonobacteraceae bacterium]|nr:hypothetical protein [Ktedonobacteraceae bacterium]